MTSEEKPAVSVDQLLPIWLDGGLGDRMYKAMHAYLDDYVFSPDEGADHDPTEFERILLEDFFAGAIGDDAVNLILQEAARAMSAALSAQAPVADLDRVAASLASMITDYVEGGIRSNQNWRNGLPEIIAARLQRLTAAPPVAREDGSIREQSQKWWATLHPDEQEAALASVRQTAVNPAPEQPGPDDAQTRALKIIADGKSGEYQSEPAQVAGEAGGLVENKDVTVSTFEYYLAEADNGWCKIPRRVAADMVATIKARSARIEALTAENAAKDARIADCQQANGALSIALMGAENALAAEREKVEAAREFAKRHPALTLIDLAEFEAFLKVPAAMSAALAREGE